MLVLSSSFRTILLGSKTAVSAAAVVPASSFLLSLSSSWSSSSSFAAFSTPFSSVSRCSSSTGLQQQQQQHTAHHNNPTKYHHTAVSFAALVAAAAAAASGWVTATTNNQNNNYTTTLCDTNPAASSSSPVLTAAGGITTNDSATVKKMKKDTTILLNKRRMTNVGRFALVSETTTNPSIPVLVLAMTGPTGWTAQDFDRLYRERQIAHKHPRFHATLDPTHTYFVFDHNTKTTTTAESKMETKEASHTTNAGRRSMGNNVNNTNYRRPTTNQKNVRDVAFPAIPTAELKDRINAACLYHPLDLTTRLWEAWTATGGKIGQSGAILHSSTNNTSEKNGSDPSDVESLLLFRAHHCMADGVSLGAVFGDLMDEGPEFQKQIEAKLQFYQKSKKRRPWWKRCLVFLYYWVYGTGKAVAYQLQLFGVAWYGDLCAWYYPDDGRYQDPWKLLQAVYDEKQHPKEQQSAVSASPSAVRPAPRSLAWSSIAPVDEVKKVAQYYSQHQQQHENNGEGRGNSNLKSSHITINDVFCSCVSAAIVKQLQYHRAVNPHLAASASSSSSSVLALPSLNLIIPVHLQGGILLPGQSMGNKIGAMVARIPGERLFGTKTNTAGSTKNPAVGHVTNPVVSAHERLVQVHTVLHARKQTPIAVLSYLMAGVMGYVSSSSSSSTSSSSSSTSWFTPWLFRKAHANASVVVTNVRGPEQLVHLDGRPVRSFLGFLPLPAGVPIGICLNSYNNDMIVTVTAEQYAVPDAEQFVDWIADEYEQLKRNVPGL